MDRSAAPFSQVRRKLALLVPSLLVGFPSLQAPWFAATWANPLRAAPRSTLGASSLAAAVPFHLSSSRIASVTAFTICVDGSSTESSTKV